MIARAPLLVLLVELVDRIPEPPRPEGTRPRRRGRIPFYVDRLFLKALIVMIVRRIHTAAAWTKSGWHGWVYGWKLHLLSTVAAVWIPLAAELTPANAADNEVAEALLGELPAEVRFLLGDQHYNAPNVRAKCEPRGC